MNIHLNDTEPIFGQIMNHIKAEIGTGALHMGDKLPSIRELSKTLQVNPNTVGRAYQELEREGITVTKRGLGVFINEAPDQLAGLRDAMAKKYIETFVHSMKTLGFSLEEMINALQNPALMRISAVDDEAYLAHIRKEL